MSDLIDRQKVLELPRDVTRNLQGEIVEESIDIEAIKSLPSVEPESKCNSCRYSNLEWYEEPCDSCTTGGESCHYKPERKKGKWIVTSEFDDCCYAKCNQCNVTQVFYYGKPLTNFCPNCGCDMRGDGNDEVNL